MSRSENASHAVSAQTSDEAPSGAPPAPGLRERKKMNTRRAIRHHALELFLRKGYQETTVKQIVAAADVSESTFFRYFPTKEDVVLTDEYDPLFVAALHAQPVDLSDLDTVLNAFRQSLEEIPESERQDQRKRGDLILRVPELRARLMDDFLAGTGLVAEALAARHGAAEPDIQARAIAGAAVGAMLAPMIQPRSDDERDFIEVAAAALQALQQAISR